MKINLTKVLIGTDFELFIVDEENQFISAIPLIEGTKNEPQVIDDKGNAIQHDGVLAEFNAPPVDLGSREEMWANIQFGLEHCSEKLPKTLKLKCCTNGTFSDAQLDTAEARQAGCTESYNAWNDGRIEEAPDFKKTNERCCGFHVHISAPGLKVQEGMRLIRLLDINLALPLLFLDEDNKRRMLYGKMGSFRFKDYGDVCGVEYRTLSNIVVKNKEIFDYVWKGIEMALEQFNKGKDYLAYKEQLEEAINNYNLDQAAELCEAFGVERLLEEEVEC